MTRFWLADLAVVASVGLCQAQTPTPQTASAPVARFSATSRVVMVNVVASYPGGDSIEGLTANDFMVTEDGVPQRVMFFEYQKVDDTHGMYGGRTKLPISSYCNLGYYTTNRGPDDNLRKINISLAGNRSAKLDFRAGYYDRWEEPVVANAAPGPGVTLPALQHKVEPAYSEQALHARFQGANVLRITVNADGSVGDVQMRRGSLGLGLDEKAIEAVKQWKFTPGKKDLVAVPMAVQVVVSFRLL